MKIILGTVQFGQRYGVGRNKVKVRKQEVFSILDLAYEKGIDTLDTAYSYGSSEERIGEFISRSKCNFNVISKIPDLKDSGPSALENICLKSLGRLKQRTLYGYLVHRFDNILRFKKLWEKLDSLKQKRIVKKIGFSLYNVEELRYLLNENVLFDIVQLPYSIFDQRFDKYFPILKKRKIEIYVRSVFLRGMCFLKKVELVGEYKPMADSMRNLRRLSKSYKIPISALCLCFVSLNSFIDKVVIGVGSAKQLKEDLDLLKYSSDVKGIYGMLKSLKLKDNDPVLSYNWK